MSDLTDERLAELVHWSSDASYGGMPDTHTALLELQRHRAAQTADEERVRSVVLKAWNSAHGDMTLRDDQLADAIATRAAKQLASAAARLTAEDFSRIKATRDEMSRFMFLDQIPEMSERIDLGKLESKARADALALDGLHGDPSKRGGWIGHRDHARNVVALIARIRELETALFEASGYARDPVQFARRFAEVAAKDPVLT